MVLLINQINKAKKTNKYILSLPLLVLCLPAVINLLLFHYLPIFGIVTAFKKFTYTGGILNSPWIGFDNFKFFFESSDAIRVIFNSLGYSIWFIITNKFFSIVVALLLYEVSKKYFLKFFQTSMAIPSMISFSIITYIVYAVLSTDSGLLNNFLANFGVERITWYNSPGYWPGILTIVNLWQSVGMGCVVYYAALMGVDESLYEAAKLDGASRIQQIRYISIPSIIPVICIMLIMSMSNILGGGIGLFYQVTMQSSALIPTTDVISTYILRGLTLGDEQMGIAAAVGLFQNLVGCIMLISSNLIVKKISPENSMF
jgi:putative aldouronate transport system permease protein